ncbi:bifunctional acyl-CoA synthetase/GNAT family N-acetyltransferase [Legionella israelensis]|uniref:Bifunctional acyl-CoA synthetase/GNAT family N-acetyltransferase n=1 Tax=Legionella israelensis TaxID=454 RepID=A0AAX1EFV7_9GAMM|nr:bifunctional acetate--CoA ligase family protein/GNAT family N-acetyltransferase [Legionella israelensis]QBR83975.1 bifunctional acyl-CoA synthetase/GNAT family N-acetyltransferase [Legionella israelensis]
MQSLYLNHIFNPSSIAVIGASSKKQSIGYLILRNLITEKFQGKIYAVNPSHEQVQNKKSYPTVLDIGEPVDLAIITAPAKAMPEIIKQCGEARVKSAIVISAGFSETGKEGKKLEMEILDIAKKYNVRILGPNCLGVISTQHALNATFSEQMAKKGNISFISQSGAIFAIILDWAYSHDIGFSKLISLGNASDIGFGELLDYLSLDPQTASILLYIEGIQNARQFLSGLRVAARLKPVIVIKSGRKKAGQKAAQSHTAAIVGSDDVFDAALQRAGVVRVFTIEQFFSASQLLSANLEIKGNRLGIITNGGGPGVMAADHAATLNIKIPSLSEDTTNKLNQMLPSNWSHNNPIDVLGDATPERFADVLSICLKDNNFDGLLTMLTPIAMSKPVDVASAVIQSIEKNKAEKPVIAAWLGEKKVAPAWELFSQHNIPYFQTPEAAIEGFSYLARYYQSQQFLLQVPETLSSTKHVDMDGAHLIIETALSQNRKLLSSLESKAILSAFDIPVNPTYLAHDHNEALIIAETIGLPVAMKIHSPDITHKKDVDGVFLNVKNAQEVRKVFHQLIENVKKNKPDAKIEGITIEPMSIRANARELLLGLLHDETFGPVVTFGAGGTFVEILQDRAIELPPVNTFICKRLIEKTRVSKLLDEYRNMPAVDKTALMKAIIRVCDIACELPEIKELDINPLISDENGVLVLDARIVVDFPRVSRRTYNHMAIHPYPRHLVHDWQLADGTDVTIRPIRPEDAKIEHEFVRNLGEESKYFRFFQMLHELTPEMLIRFTQIDYDREMAFIAVIEQNEKRVNIGVARYVILSDGITCEYAIVVADSWQNKGVGSHLMNHLIEEATSKGLKQMYGEILKKNENMIELAENLGFTIKPHKEDSSIVISIKSLK